MITKIALIFVWSFTLFKSFNFAYSLNIDKVVSLTLKNSILIKNAHKNLEKVIAENFKGNNELIPDIKLYFENTKFSEDSYLSHNNKYQNASIYFNQLIFSGGKNILKTANANILIKEAYQEYNNIVNNTVYELIKCYVKIYGFKKLAKIQKQNILVVKKLINNLKKQAINKNLGNNDILKIKSILIRTYSNFQMYIITKKEAENYCRNITKSSKLYNVEEINFLKYKTIIKFNDMLFIMKKNNPIILKSRYKLIYAKQKINANICNLFPIVSLFYSVSKTNNVKVNLFEKNIDKNLIKNNISLGIKIFLPLLSKTMIPYLEMNKSKKRYKIERNNLDYSIYITKSNIKNAWNNFLLNSVLYQESIRIEYIFLQSYNLSQKELMTSKNTIFEVISKQQEYNLSSIVKIQREMECLLSLFYIHKIIGILSDIMF